MAEVILSLNASKKKRDKIFFFLHCISFFVCLFVPPALSLCLLNSFLVVISQYFLVVVQFLCFLLFLFCSFLLGRFYRSTKTKTKTCFCLFLFLFSSAGSRTAGRKRKVVFVKKFLDKNESPFSSTKTSRRK
jgi:hypothetical protein